MSEVEKAEIKNRIAVLENKKLMRPERNVKFTHALRVSFAPCLSLTLGREGGSKHA